MARGDAVGSISSVAGDATWDIRPTPGVEWLITHIGSTHFTGAAPNATPNIIIDLTDGTNVSTLGTQSSALILSAGFKIFITNSLWLRLLNGVSLTAYLSYCGVVWNE